MADSSADEGANRLRVKEIYRSIQGESSYAGRPCVFVRTAGCDIRCTYCDEPHAFTGGEQLSIAQVLARVAELGVRLVEVTGGEPLLQRATPALVEALLAAGHEVLIETGGHHDISVLDSRAHAIVDVKTPGSHMDAHNDLANLARLRPGDEVKFVLCGRDDYEWARELLAKHEVPAGTPIHFSPVHGELDPSELSAWILEDGLDVRLNLQLHKYIWHPDQRGV